jgi:O-antigen/teichoic acid export membrane protein
MLLTLSTLSGELLRGFQKIRDLAIYGIINALVLTVFLYIFIDTLGLVGAVIAYTASSFISLVILSIMVIKTLNSEKIQLGLYLNAKETYEMIKYSFPIFLSTFITTPQKLIVSTYLSIAVNLSQVGLYKIGSNLQTLFINIPSAIGVPLLPMLSELQTTSPEKIPNVIIRLLKLNILITLPFIVAAGMSIKYMIVLLYGETYVNAWNLSYIVLISLLFISMSPITMNVFLGTNRTWIIFYLDMLSTISYILFSYFLINKFGLIGAGIADLLSNMLLVLIKLIYLKAYMNVDIQQLGKPFLLSSTFIITSYFLITLYDGIILLVEGFFLVIGLLIIEYFILSSDDRNVIKTNISKLLSRSKLCKMYYQK